MNSFCTVIYETVGSFLKMWKQASQNWPKIHLTKYGYGFSDLLSFVAVETSSCETDCVCAGASCVTVPVV